MAKPLEPGMKFTAPISGERWAPGYVVHQGPLFVLVNVFHDVKGGPDEPMDFDDKPLLMRDLVITDLVFSKSKRVTENPWRLFRTKFARNPLPPEHDAIILGSGDRNLHIKRLSDGGLVTRSPTAEQLEGLPRASTASPSYYSLLIEAELDGKTVMLEENPRRYVLRDA